MSNHPTDIPYGFHEAGPDDFSYPEEAVDYVLHRADGSPLIVPEELFDELRNIHIGACGHVRHEPLAADVDNEILVLFAMGLLDECGNVTDLGVRVYETITAQHEAEADHGMALREADELDELEAACRRRPVDHPRPTW